MKDAALGQQRKATIATYREKQQALNPKEKHLSKLDTVCKMLRCLIGKAREGSPPQDVYATLLRRIQDTMVRVGQMPEGDFFRRRAAVPGDIVTLKPYLLRKDLREYTGFLFVVESIGLGLDHGSKTPTKPILLAELRKFQGRKRITIEANRIILYRA